VAVYRFKFRILWDRAGRSQLSHLVCFGEADEDLPENKGIMRDPMGRKYRFAGLNGQAELCTKMNRFGSV